VDLAFVSACGRLWGSGVLIYWSACDWIKITDFTVGSCGINYKTFHEWVVKWCWQQSLDIVRYSLYLSLFTCTDNNVLSVMCMHFMQFIALIIENTVKMTAGPFKAIILFLYDKFLDLDGQWPVLFSRQGCNSNALCNNRNWKYVMKKKRFHTKLTEQGFRAARQTASTQKKMHRQTNHTKEQH